MPEPCQAPECPGCQCGNSAGKFPDNEGSQSLPFQDEKQGTEYDLDVIDSGQVMMDTAFTAKKAHIR